MLAVGPASAGAYNKKPRHSSGGAACVSGVSGVWFLVPERAQSCRAAMAAVVMAMRVMKDGDHLT
jgi:hypothetical protein